MSYFSGKVAVVTGGASGIGRELCLQLARQGAAVTVADVDLPGAEQTARLIAAAGGDAMAAEVDVASAERLQRLVDDVVARHGRLDLMVNNAGIGMAGEIRDMGIADWDRIVDVNLKGVLYGTHAAYRQMLRQGSGHILNIASSAGLMLTPGMAPYSITKHAVVVAGRTLRREAATLGVRVTVACPGFVRTPIYENSVYVGMRQRTAQDLPVRMIAVEDCVAAILDGVARNRELVVFPLYARLCWWLSRLAPWLMRPVELMLLRGYRRLREDQGLSTDFENGFNGHHG